MIATKTAQEFLSDIKTSLADEGFSTLPSSVVMLFSKIIADQLGEQSDQIEDVYRQAHLSTAVDEHLDLIGNEKGVSRLINETDDDYRYRLSKAELALQGNNYEGIRQTLLRYEEIKDVVMTPYVYGAGSGLILLITHDPFAGHDVLEHAQELAQPLCWGTRLEIVLPTPRVVNIDIEVTFDAGLTETQQQTLREDIHLTVFQYIAGLKPGETLVVSEIIARVHQVSVHGAQAAEDTTDVREARIVGLYVDEQERLLENIEVARTDRLVPDTSPNGIAII